MFGLLIGHAGSINVGGRPEGRRMDHCRGGGREGEGPVPASAGQQRHIGMRGDDLHDDIEIGLAIAAFQRLQLCADMGAVERPGRVELGLQPGARGRHAERLATVGDVFPVQVNVRVTGQRAVGAVEHVIQRIQARSEVPVFVGHEDTVDLGVEAGDVVDRASFQGQGQAMHGSADGVERGARIDAEKAGHAGRGSVDSAWTLSVAFLAQELDSQKTPPRTCVRRLNARRALTLRGHDFTAHCSRGADTHPMSCE